MWYFLDKIFKFQSSVSKGCHHVLMMAVNINSIAILHIQGVVYHCIIIRISKSETIKLLENAELREKVHFDQVQYKR